MIGKWLQKVSDFFCDLTPQKGWLIVMLTSLLIAILDIAAPPQYIFAYLYIIPIFISLSLLNKKATVNVLLLAVLATLSDLFIPTPLEEWRVPYIVISRLIVILFMATTVSFFFYRNRYKEQIQEKEKLLSEAYHLAQLREDFIAALTHDLKTPLLGGQKVLQYLEDGTLGALTEVQTSAIETLLRGNMLQLELVETLLTIYRNDNLGISLHVETADLNELIQESISQLKYIGLEQGITVNYIATEEQYQIQADKVQIQRVILNLLHNALSYAPLNSEIQVHLESQENFIRISVRDSGPGLSPGDLKNIFSRLYQVNSQQRPMTSTGLGLYLARQIVQSHGGEIWAENLKPSGCQISFTLPCLDVIQQDFKQSMMLSEAI